MKILFFLLILTTFFACKKNKETLIPVACFTYNSNSLLNIQDTIKFANCSENAASYIWDFGDSVTSTEKSPFHIYQKSGDYTIKLKTLYSNHMDSMIETIKVNPCTLNLNTTETPQGNASYTFDIDKDGINDLTFSMSYHFGGMRYRPEYYTAIGVTNGYEINVTNYIDTTWTYNRDTHAYQYQYDSVVIAKILKINTMAYFDDSYLKYVYITYRQAAGAWELGEWSGIFRKNWISSDNGYIVLRKKIENEKTMVLLKVKVLDYCHVEVFSYICIKNTDSIFINE